MLYEGETFEREPIAGDAAGHESFHFESDTVGSGLLDDPFKTKNTKNSNNAAVRVASRRTCRHMAGNIPLTVHGCVGGAAIKNIRSDDFRSRTSTTQTILYRSNRYLTRLITYQHHVSCLILSQGFASQVSCLHF
jgi:hypothetical protein